MAGRSRSLGVKDRLLQPIRDYGQVLRVVVPGQLMYRNAQLLSVTLEVDPAKMRTFMPAGLRLAEPYRADLFTAWFPETSFGNGYLAAGLLVHVRTRTGVGVHCPWLVADDDDALILGREVAGYPTKLATITWESDGEQVTAAAARRGSPLLSMNARIREQLPAAPFLGRPHRNVGPFLGLLVPAVFGFAPRETVREVHAVDLDFEMRGSDRDPIDRMGLGEVVGARLHRVDLTASMVPPLPLRPVPPTYVPRHLCMRAL
ncbi:MAG: acetoacetate decarboxylase family protein [Bacillota bacterium]